ncbi:MAG: hypothetical protein Unbinned8622contig1003_41 [Prokaryotic dsDNA virus sp.]|nr:MAG: hypothetical protein Unbinned8622contig1003_41 [Prokaryotic dsDNA virus sp.]|tara:strand:- start:22756 stop:23106 length:351 start_codon:yes stop_codon:yes gene_type:complete
MKFIGILPAALIAAAPVYAGPYAVIENNAGFTGSDFTGHTTDFHVGYEESGPWASWGVQAGPTVFSPDGDVADTKLTGKVFGSLVVTDKVSVYGELSAAFDETNSYGTKAGVKYSF